MTQTVPHKYSNVVLGFPEPAPDTFAASQFPSKTGGCPVWLYRPPHNPPPPPRCPICLQPQRFLLQVYAPLEPSDVAHADAFHRVLYVSICRSPSCQRDSRCASVLRAQLPRRNVYYSYDGCDDGPVIELVEEGGEVCDLCGFGGVKRCGACQSVSYCGRVCQSTDWKLGHKDTCGTQVGQGALEAQRRKWRYPELEIITDHHPTPPGSDDGESDSDEEDRPVTAQDRNDARGSVRGDDVVGSSDEPHSQPKPPQPGSIAVTRSENTKEVEMKFSESERPSTTPEAGQAEPAPGATENAPAVGSPLLKGTFQDADDEELPEELFQGRQNAQRDGAFAHFNKVVSYASDQIVRYERDGSPLWASRKGRCIDVDKCELCGEERVFELQVMPQLAYFLSETKDGKELSIEQIAKRLRDDAEWGTICVFTCGRSCEIGERYVKEFAWMQRLQ